MPCPSARRPRTWRWRCWDAQCLGAIGHVIEFCGDTIRGFDMAGRMTVSNMSVEVGARASLIAPDQTTFDYIRGRPFAPKDGSFDRAVAGWRSLASDAGATYDRSTSLDVAKISPMATSWAPIPRPSCRSRKSSPIPDDAPNEGARLQRRRMLDYMGLAPGQRMTDLAIDVVFIGSCHQRPHRRHPGRRRRRSRPQGIFRRPGARRAGIGPGQAAG